MKNQETWCLSAVAAVVVVGVLATLTTLVVNAAEVPREVEPDVEMAMSASTRTDGADVNDRRIRGLVDAVILRQGDDPLLKVKQYDDEGISYSTRHSCDTDPDDERIVYLYVRDGEPEGEPGDPGYGEARGVMAAQMIQQAQVAAVSNKWVRVEVDDGDLDDGGRCRLTGISIYRR